MVSSEPLRRIRLVLALACLVVGPQPVSAARLEPSVILLSLDGTRPADVDEAPMPAVQALAHRGLRAARMLPVLPSNTFPNHVSLVTGVAPERHGIVNNVFLDPERGLFRYASDPTWIQVEPLWSVAARAGIVSASFHWVGSEGAWRNGLGPRHWRAFDSGTPVREKIDQILAWLALDDPAERPRLVTAWLPGADRAAHHAGPGSEEAREALREQDRELARLVRGLEALGAFESCTLLLVSDHGMARVERRADLRGRLRAQGIQARVLGGGGFASVLLEDERQAAGAARAARELGLEAWVRSEAPAELRLGNPRFGDVVVMAPVGTALGRGSSWLGGLAARLLGRSSSLGGSHGHPPEAPEMAALFVAAGRGVPAGARTDMVRAVDVAPTVLELLGVRPPEWMEGRPIEAISFPPSGEESP